MTRLLIFLELWRSRDDEGEPIGLRDAWRIAGDLAARELEGQ